MVFPDGGGCHWKVLPSCSGGGVDGISDDVYGASPGPHGDGGDSLLRF